MTPLTDKTIGPRVNEDLKRLSCVKYMWTSQCGRSNWQVTLTLEISKLGSLKGAGLALLQAPTSQFGLWFFDEWCSVCERQVQGKGQPFFFLPAVTLTSGGINDSGGVGERKRWSVAPEYKHREQL